MDGEYLITDKVPPTNENCYLPVFEHGQEGKGKLCLAMEEDGTVYCSTAPLHPSTTAACAWCMPHPQGVFTAPLHLPCPGRGRTRFPSHGHLPSRRLDHRRPVRDQPHVGKSFGPWVFWLTNAKKGKPCTYPTMQFRETATEKKR